MVLQSVEEENIYDISVFKKNKLSFSYIIIHPFSTIKLFRKIRRIPKSFLKIFDQKSYLYANPDVKDSIEKKHFNSALEHFILYGYDEVKNAKRRIGNEFPFMTEEEYLNVNPDLKTAFSEGKIDSAFGHFIAFGYKEFKNKTRVLTGHYDFELTNEIQDLLFEKFNEDEYLAVNPDLGSVKNIDAWKHFLEYGIDEIRRGERIFSQKFPYISEYEYVVSNPDVLDNLKRGIISSPARHFFLQGMWQILNGDRIIENKYIYKYYEPIINKNIQSEINNFIKKPLISIVMPVYNVDVKWLDLAIESLKNQWYNNWELCICDDASTKIDTLTFLKSLNDSKIKIKFLDKNVNISGASNEALKLATGEYIALMDNDDELTVDALYEVVKTINETGSEFIYSDEDKIELDGNFTDPHFKPDFSFEMFLSTNYLSHLGVIKKSLIDKVNGWEIGLEGSQDYDLYLKVLEHTRNISHIQKVLYHWRKVPGSTASEYGEKSYAHEAGAKALKDALIRRKILAEVENGMYPGTYRIKYEIINKPLISIIIPFKDEPELLNLCISSIIEKSTYENYEIIGISNNSKKTETFSIMKTLESKDSRIHFHEYNEPFNYSAINNHAVNKYAKGEQILLLNNDVEIISPNWMEAMLEFSQQPNIGAVGAKLYYPNDSIQHAGVIIGIADSADHAHKLFLRNAAGYFSRLQLIQNFSAVTAACLMVKKTLYDKLGGLNEKNLKIAYNDVDLCLRIMDKGYRNVFTPYAEAYHYESISRGAEDSSEKIKRLYEERGYLQERHYDIFQNGDPYYNKNLTSNNIGFSVNEMVSNQKYKFEGKDFSEKIIKFEILKEKQHNKVCVFSHFDKDNIIDNYVIYYLSELSKKYDIIFVSTAMGLSKKEVKKVESYCMQYIVKENYGYDFGAWKTGLDSLGLALHDYDWLTLCNDSVYGPVQPIECITDILDKNMYDILPLSMNYEKKKHFQSYFVSYSKVTFKSDLFQEFWNNFKIYDDKTDLVNICEVEFSNILMQQKNLRVGTLAKRYENTFSNLLQFYWKNLIKDGFPFIKIELLKINPSKINISDWRRVLKSNTNYPIKLIENHLKRMIK